MLKFMCVFATKTGHLFIRFSNRRIYRIFLPSRAPVLEVNLESLKHLFFDVFNVGELAPTSHIAVLRCTLNFNDEFFHQPQLVPIFFPKMLFTNVSSLFLAVLGS